MPAETGRDQGLPPRNDQARRPGRRLGQEVEIYPAVLGLTIESEPNGQLGAVRALLHPGLQEYSSPLRPGRRDEG